MQTFLDHTFAALADPTRRALVARLALGDLTVSALAEPFEMSLPAVSKHLSVLTEAGLVLREKRGREIICRLGAAPMKAAADWLATYRQFWDERLDALGDYLQQETAKEKQTWTQPQPQRSASPALTPPRRKKSSTRGPARKPCSAGSRPATIFKHPKSQSMRVSAGATAS